jgi:hypothetical protein
VTVKIKPLSIFLTKGNKMSPVRNSLKSVLGTVGAAALLGCASMNAMACGDNAYLGEVCTFAFDFCPVNFAPANGQLLPIAQPSGCLICAAEAPSTTVRVRDCPLRQSHRATVWKAQR